MAVHVRLDETQIRSHELWGDVPSDEISTLIQLLDEGKEVEAVKHFRSVTGTGLGLAQAAIDAVVVGARSRRDVGDSDEVIPLSGGTVRRLRVVFRAELRDEAIRLLTAGCGSNLLPAGRGLDRIRRAVLRESRGSLAKLRDAIELAQTDWRDILVAADFLGVVSHIRWMFLRQWFQAP